MTGQWIAPAAVAVLALSACHADLTQPDAARPSHPIAAATTNVPCTLAPAGLVSWWPGDGNANDITAPNHGTLQNGATFAPGLVGQAFSLDGSDDYVAVPNSPSLNIGSGDFSLDVWVETSVGLPSLQIIMDKRVGTIDTPRLGYHFFVGAAGVGFQMADQRAESFGFATAIRGALFGAPPQESADYLDGWDAALKCLAERFFGEDSAEVKALEALPNSRTRQANSRRALPAS